MNVRQSLFYSLLTRNIGFIIQFTTNIIISRLLLPAEIGVFSLSVMGLGIVQALREFGVGRYLVKEKHLTDDHIRTGFGLMILTSWSFAAIIFPFRDAIASFYDRPELASIIGLLLINFIIVPFGLPAMALLNRRMEFRKTFVIIISASLANATVGISCAYAGLSSYSLAYAAIASTSIQALLALYFEQSHLRLRPSLTKWRDMTSFGVFASAASVMNTVGANTAEIVLGKVLTFTAVGLYSRANGLLTVLQNQLMVALTRVAFPGFAKLLHSGEKIEAKYLRAISFLTGFLWPVYVTLAFSSHALMVFLFGANWEGAADAARVLCVNGMVLCSFTLMQSVYDAHGAVRKQLIIEAMVQTIRIALILFTAPFGIAAVAGAQTLTSVINAIIYHRMIRSLFTITLADFWRAVHKSAIITVITAAALTAAFMALEEYPHSNLVTLVTAGLVGLISWALGVRLTGHEIGPEVMTWISAAARKLRRS